MVPRLLAFGYDYDLARHARDGPRSSRPAIVRSRSGLRERRGELRGRPRGDEEHFKRGGLRAAGCPKEERLLWLRDGAAQRRRGGAALECGVIGSARMRAQRFCVFDAAARSARARQSNLCPAQSNLTFEKLNPTMGKGEILPLLLWCSHVACYAVRSAFFHRMAPRSEPLGSRPAPWLKTRHWHQIAFQAARTRAVIISGIGADSGSKGCLRRRSGKGQRESGSKRAALEGDLSQNHACPHPPGPRGERPRGHE